MQTSAGSQMLVTIDPSLPTCFLVRGPSGPLARLIPGLPPMRDHFTVHFLEGEIPVEFRGISKPWGIKEEILERLKQAWEAN